MTHHVMLIDVERCGGCRTCTVACKMANATPPAISWCRVQTREGGKYPVPELSHIPRQCMQCAEPPCVPVCPAGAGHRRPDGVVALDAAKCSGARACIGACPYGMRRVSEIRPYHPESGFTAFEEAAYRERHPGVPEKCDFCVARVAQGEQPVCVAACPSHARLFGDLDDAGGEVAATLARRRSYRLLPERNTRPSVYYLEPFRATKACDGA